MGKGVTNPFGGAATSSTHSTAEDPLSLLLCASDSATSYDLVLLLGLSFVFIIVRWTLSKRKASTKYHIHPCSLVFSDPKTITSANILSNLLKSVTDSPKSDDKTDLLTYTDSIKRGVPRLRRSTVASESGNVSSFGCSVPAIINPTEKSVSECKTDMDNSKDSTPVPESQADSFFTWDSGGGSGEYSFVHTAVELPKYPDDAITEEERQMLLLYMQSGHPQLLLSSSAINQASSPIVAASENVVASDSVAIRGFLETIVEETSDDLRSPSECDETSLGWGSWDESDDDRVTVVEVQTSGSCAENSNSPNLSLGEIIEKLDEVNQLNQKANQISSTDTNSSALETTSLDNIFNCEQISNCSNQYPLLSRDDELYSDSLFRETSENNLHLSQPERNSDIVCADKTQFITSKKDIFLKGNEMDTISNEKDVKLDLKVSPLNSFTDTKSDFDALWLSVDKLENPLTSDKTWNSNQNCNLDILEEKNVNNSVSDAEFLNDERIANGENSLIMFGSEDDLCLVPSSVTLNSSQPEHTFESLSFSDDFKDYFLPSKNYSSSFEITEIKDGDIVRMTEEVSICSEDKNMRSFRIGLNEDVMPSEGKNSIRVAEISTSFENNFSSSDSEAEAMFSPLNGDIVYGSTWLGDHESIPEEAASGAETCCLTSTTDVRRMPTTQSESPPQDNNRRSVSDFEQSASDEEIQNVSGSLSRWQHYTDLQHVQEATSPLTRWQHQNNLQLFSKEENNFENSKQTISDDSDDGLPPQLKELYNSFKTKGKKSRIRIKDDKINNFKALGLWDCETKVTLPPFQNSTPEKQFSPKQKELINPKEELDDLELDMFNATKHIPKSIHNEDSDIDDALRSFNHLDDYSSNSDEQSEVEPDFDNSFIKSHETELPNNLILKDTQPAKFDTLSPTLVSEAEAHSLENPCSDNSDNCPLCRNDSFKKSRINNLFSEPPTHAQHSDVQSLLLNTYPKLTRLSESNLTDPESRDSTKDLISSLTSSDSDEGVRGVKDVKKRIKKRPKDSQSAELKHDDSGYVEDDEDDDDDSLEEKKEPALITAKLIENSDSSISIKKSELNSNSIECAKVKTSAAFVIPPTFEEFSKQLEQSIGSEDFKSVILRDKKWELPENFSQFSTWLLEEELKKNSCKSEGETVCEKNIVSIEYSNEQFLKKFETVEKVQCDNKTIIEDNYLNIPPQFSIVGEDFDLLSNSKSKSNSNLSKITVDKIEIECTQIDITRAENNKCVESLTENKDVLNFTHNLNPSESITEKLPNLIDYEEIIVAGKNSNDNSVLSEIKKSNNDLVLNDFENSNNDLIDISESLVNENLKNKNDSLNECGDKSGIDNTFDFHFDYEIEKPPTTNIVPCESNLLFAELTLIPQQSTIATMETHYKVGNTTISQNVSENVSAKFTATNFFRDMNDEAPMNQNTNHLHSHDSCGSVEEVAPPFGGGEIVSPIETGSSSLDLMTCGEEKGAREGCKKKTDEFSLLQAADGVSEEQKSHVLRNSSHAYGDNNLTSHPALGDETNSNILVKKNDLPISKENSLTGSTLTNEISQLLGASGEDSNDDSLKYLTTVVSKDVRSNNNVTSSLLDCAKESQFLVCSDEVNDSKQNYDENICSEVFNEIIGRSINETVLTSDKTTSENSVLVEKLTNELTNSISQQSSLFRDNKPDIISSCEGNSENFKSATKVDYQRSSSVGRATFDSKDNLDSSDVQSKSTPDLRKCHEQSSSAPLSARLSKSVCQRIQDYLGHSARGGHLNRSLPPHERSRHYRRICVSTETVVERAARFEARSRSISATREGAEDSYQSSSRSGSCPSSNMRNFEKNTRSYNKPTATVKPTVDAYRSRNYYGLQEHYLYNVKSRFEMPEKDDLLELITGYTRATKVTHKPPVPPTTLTSQQLLKNARLKGKIATARKDFFERLSQQDLSRARDDHKSEVEDDQMDSSYELRRFDEFRRSAREERVRLAASHPDLGALEAAVRSSKRKIDQLKKKKKSGAQAGPVPLDAGPPPQQSSMPSTTKNEGTLCLPYRRCTGEIAWASCAKRLEEAKSKSKPNLAQEQLEIVDRSSFWFKRPAETRGVRAHRPGTVDDDDYEENSASSNGGDSAIAGAVVVENCDFLGTRAKSMDFLLDADNRDKVQPPENRLAAGQGRVKSEHELRIERSLQNLTIPDWYKQSAWSKKPKEGFILRRGSEGSAGESRKRWQGFSTSRTPSATSLTTPQNTYSHRNIIVPKRVTPTSNEWRYVGSLVSSRESLTPASPASLSPRDCASAAFQYGLSSSLSRWSSSRLSTSSAPLTTLGVHRSFRQPYLGWRAAAASSGYTPSSGGGSRTSPITATTPLDGSRPSSPRRGSQEHFVYGLHHNQITSAATLRPEGEATDSSNRISPLALNTTNVFFNSNTEIAHPDSHAFDHQQQQQQRYGSAEMRRDRYSYTQSLYSGTVIMSPGATDDDKRNFNVDQIPRIIASLEEGVVTDSDQRFTLVKSPQPPPRLWMESSFVGTKQDGSEPQQMTRSIRIVPSDSVRPGASTSARSSTSSMRGTCATQTAMDTRELIDHLHNFLRGLQNRNQVLRPSSTSAFSPVPSSSNSGFHEATLNNNNNNHTDDDGAPTISSRLNRDQRPSLVDYESEPRGYPRGSWRHSSSSSKDISPDNSSTDNELWLSVGDDMGPKGFRVTPEHHLDGRSSSRSSISPTSPSPRYLSEQKRVSEDSTGSGRPIFFASSRRGSKGSNQDPKLETSPYHPQQHLPSNVIEPSQQPYPPAKEQYSRKSSSTHSDESGFIRRDSKSGGSSSWRDSKTDHESSSATTSRGEKDSKSSASMEEVLESLLAIPPISSRSSSPTSPRRSKQYGFQPTPQATQSQDARILQETSTQGVKSPLDEQIADDLIRSKSTSSRTSYLQSGDPRWAADDGRGLENVADDLGKRFDDSLNFPPPFPSSSNTVIQQLPFSSPMDEVNHGSSFCHSSSASPLEDDVQSPTSMEVLVPEGEEQELSSIIEGRGPSVNTTTTTEDKGTTQGASGGTPSKKRKPARGIPGTISATEGHLKCHRPKCTKSLPVEEARAKFRTCPNCYTYYCSRQCRKLHLTRHKEHCPQTRISNLCKQVLMKARDDPVSRRHLSLCAKRGLLSRGRGAVKLLFLNPDDALDYLVHGWESAKGQTLYVSRSDLLPQEMGSDVFSQVRNFCDKYNPERKFILLAAITVTNEIAAALEREVVVRGAKMHLSPSMPEDDVQTLILTITKTDPETGDPAQTTVEDRRNGLSVVEEQLSARGVDLEKLYPHTYRKILRFVNDNEPFTPISIFPTDQRNGRVFMCIILPWADADIIVNISTKSGAGVTKSSKRKWPL